ncbi:DNA polymerase beta domain protein region [[Leptolyngbya] sp. PCC 7376]|uniref:nucleotidyltransferase family protein n=1 Tax=[Leptolyngbya] sp. PCC 7376 TaxID=111781 RepID=UPI00029F0C74|nr:DNA polymerase beta domain protein region [[Leptolyngbya] sp. PCC 7376]
MVSTDEVVVLNPTVKIPSRALEEICQRWKITELSCFGSVLRDDFRIDSDIDLLVSFAADAKITFFNLDTIEQEFSELFGDRPIDIVTRHSIENSHNPIRRRNILEHSQVLYNR